ncbi:MAG: J domain-containing protein [Cyanobacteriota bacterium]
METPQSEGANPAARRRFTSELSLEMLANVDALKKEWGLRNRGDVLERLLREVFPSADDDRGTPGALPAPGAARDLARAMAVGALENPALVDGDGEDGAINTGALNDGALDAGTLDEADPAGIPLNEEAFDGESLDKGALDAGALDEGALDEGAVDEGALDEGALDEGALDDGAALVLVGQSGWAMEGWGAAAAGIAPGGGGPQKGGKAKGIDLPGFVRRRSQQLRRSLQVEREPEPGGIKPWPQLSEGLLRQGLDTVASHWQNLFGQAPNAAVVEAAMGWLAHDIWPHADPCEGRLFTWTAAVRLMREVAPDWSDAPPSLERVIVTAGVLEDPFSAETLHLRIPTLVHRFVHRFRRRQRGTSFQTLESTMTLHGALRQLQLPTDSGQRVTLTQIREAYRDMALKHHPDSGGSLDAMRRINEAYHLLKELYRQRPVEG